MPKKMQDMLKNDYPFTRPPFVRKAVDDATICRWIRDTLRSEGNPSGKAIGFLEKHPEHLKWLRDNIEPRFWDRLEKRRRRVEMERLEDVGDWWSESP